MASISSITAVSSSSTNDFVVAPGASAELIALAFDGATRVSVSPGGDLVLATESGNLVQRRPAIYQNEHGARRAITGGYIIRRDGTVGFHIGTYDRRLPLVIDPVLSYASYLGGVNQDRGHSVAVDAAGNVIVAGVTFSPDFPLANRSSLRKEGPAMRSSRNSIQPATLSSTPTGLACGGNDEARDAAVDDAGNAYVAGFTDSSDFPASSTIGSAQTRKQMFVVKLDSTVACVCDTNRRLGK